MSNRFVLLFHDLADRANRADLEQVDSVEPAGQVGHIEQVDSVEPAKAGRSSHWDLMLESVGRLETWALETDPAIDHHISALRLPPHRLEYLNYEGPVSRDRGSVRRVLDGRYRILEPGLESAPLEEILYGTSMATLEEIWYGTSTATPAGTPFRLELSWEEGVSEVDFRRDEHGRWSLRLSQLLKLTPRSR